MPKKKTYKTKKKKQNELSEPLEAYELKKVHFFNSFEEMEEVDRAYSAELSFKQRIEKLEEMRILYMSKNLLPDNSWPELERIITVKKTSR